MVFAAFHRGRFTCTRSLPLVATAGEPIRYHIEISNKRPFIKIRLTAYPQIYIPGEWEKRIEELNNKEELEKLCSNYSKYISNLVEENNIAEKEENERINKTKKSFGIK